LLHLPPLRFHYVGGCWNRTQDSCEYVIGCQMLYSNHSAPQARLNLIYTRLDLIHTRLNIILTRLDLIRTQLDLIHTRLDLIHIRLHLIELLYFFLCSQKDIVDNGVDFYTWKCSRYYLHHRYCVMLLMYGDGYRSLFYIFAKNGSSHSEHIEGPRY
jgi:hypothetical protein